MTASPSISIKPGDVICIYGDDRKLIGTVDVDDIAPANSRPVYLRVLTPVGPAYDGRVPDIDPPRQLLTMKEAAEQLSVSLSTVRKLIHSGQFRVVRPVPHIVRISRTELDAYLEKLAGRP
jgi:excisionase family DNA binding protein